MVEITGEPRSQVTLWIVRTNYVYLNRCVVTSLRNMSLFRKNHFSILKCHVEIVSMISPPNVLEMSNFSDILYLFTHLSSLLVYDDQVLPLSIRLACDIGLTFIINYGVNK